MFKIRSLKQVGLGIFLALTAFLISFLISKWIHSPLKQEGVKIYYADNISKAHDVIIKKFNEINKDRIEVIPVNLPFAKFSTNERKELLARSLRSQSDKLDVFAVDVIWVPRFTKWSEPLDNYFPRLTEKDFLPGILKTAIYDSALMAIPLYTDLMQIYYRKDLLKNIPNSKVFMQKLNAGITWKELIGFAKKRREQNPNFFIFPGKNFEGLMCMFFANLYSQGISFNENQVAIGQGPEAVGAINILSSLIHTYSISPLKVVRMDEYEGFLHFLENKGSIFVGWPGLLKQQKRVLKELGIYEHMAMAPLPRVDSGKPISIIGGWNLMISKNSKHKEAAAEFLRFTIEEENQRRLNKISGFIPVLNSLFKDPNYISTLPGLQFYKELALNSKSRPMHENYTQISDIYSYYFNRVLKGEISAAEALEKAESELISLNIDIN